jgi:hypothetical protein
MSVTPNDFLASAQSIAASGNDEMTQRNAVSRGYYAAFHYSCGLFPPDGKDRGVGMHKGYIDQLQEGSAGSDQRKAGVALAAMHGARIWADYRLDDDKRNPTFAMQVTRAQAIFSLRAPPPSSPSPGPSSPPTLSAGPHLRVIR